MVRPGAITVTLLVVAGLLTACSALLVPPPRSYTVGLSDVDGDGDVDAVVGNGPGNIDYAGEPNQVWLNDGAGRFTDSGQRLIGLKMNWDVTHAVALGDLDGDGDTDVIFGNAIQSPNTVWLNDGTGRFYLHGMYAMKPDNERGYVQSEAVALGDLDGDGDLDALVGNCCRYEWGASAPPGQIGERGNGDAYNMVWLNDGSGRFSDSGQRLGNEATGAIGLGDLDGDGDLDAFEVNQASVSDIPVSDPSDRVWLNDGMGRFTDSGQRLSPAYGQAVALGDLDGDGDLDAFVGNARPGNADEVWLNDGAGSFADSGQRLGDGNTRIVVLDDVDRDGDLDAFVGDEGFGQIWTNDGAGRFADSGQRFGWSSQYAVNLADLDGDGDRDVVAIRFSGECLVWLNDGTGHFARARGRAIIPIYLAAGGVAILGLVVIGWWAIRRKSRD